MPGGDDGSGAGSPAEPLVSGPLCNRGFTRPSAPVYPVLVLRARIGLSVVALAWTARVPEARGQAQNGDILVPEYTLGSVVNIRGGGDFSGAARFATGLTMPMGLCQGPGGHIYVTEFGANQVTIITAGGDFTGVAAFATNVSGPCSLSCSPTQIFVTELNSGQITDITAGGDYAGVPPFARITRNPADLLRADDGTLWLTSFNDGVIDITAGGDFRGDPYYAPNDLADDSSIALAQMGSMLLVGNEHTFEIVNFTAGGNLSTLPVFARVRGVIGLEYIPETNQLLASSEVDDAVYDVTEGGDFTSGATPFAFGIDPFDVAHLVYVSIGCGDGGPDPGEECDDGNDVDTDACPGNCQDAECGDGFVFEGNEECDDGNTESGDGCDASCAIESPGDPDGGTDGGADGGDADGGDSDGGADGGDADGGDSDGGGGDADGGGGDSDGGDGDSGDANGDGDSGGDGGGCSTGGSHRDGLLPTLLVLGLCLARARIRIGLRTAR